VFGRDKFHCFHINCTISVQISEELRSSHRLQIYPTYTDDVTNTFWIKDGIAENLNLRFIPDPHSYVSVHPEIVLTYSESKQPTRDNIAIQLVKTTQKEQSNFNFVLVFLDRFLK
ncbi:hypothetical protein PRIPAC_70360, partial [Pristionchus pacificus]